MEQNELCNAVKLVARSYLFLYIQIRIGTWDILPNWMGYYWILTAIPVLAREIRSAQLLKPLAIWLTGYSFAEWLVVSLGLTSYLSRIYIWELLETIGFILVVYFHFQLLTDLAELAARYQCSVGKSLLLLRTVYTVINTALAFPAPWKQSEMIYMGIAVVNLLTVFWISRKLYVLRQELWSHLNQDPSLDLFQDGAQDSV